MGQVLSHSLSVSLLNSGLPVFWQTDFLHMLADMDSQCLLYICRSLSLGLDLLCQSQLEQSQRQPRLVYLGYNSIPEAEVHGILWLARPHD